MTGCKAGSSRAARRASAGVIAVLAFGTGGAALAQVSTAGVPLGDAARGAEVWAQDCAVCHMMGEGATHDIGPHLNRVFDRRAGSLPDFDYSDSIARMGRDGLRWSFATLDAYIANPYSLVSGTRMGYPGLDSATDRADLIAFLRQYSDQPGNIPEAAPTARRIEVDLPPAVLGIRGDREFGEYLATECTTCHQRDGSASGIPSITHWPEERFVVAMHAYRQGLRPNQVMQTVAKRLDDEEIAALAHYFATIDD